MKTLENSKDFETTTISGYIQKFPSEKVLDDIFPASWINHNFDIWIGEREDNKAWDLLYRTREFLVQTQNANNKKVTAQKLKNAWEEIYIAEGSDWFWWYGDEHHSDNNLEFDSSFRQHLKNVYLELGEESPIDLDISVIEQKFNKSYYPPIAFICPCIDGKFTNFFKWYNAGFYDSEKNSGSMHKVTSIVKKFYYGFDRGFENFYFRIDTDAVLKNSSKDIIFLLEFDTNFSVNIFFDKILKKYFIEGKIGDKSEFKFSEKLEKSENVLAVDECIEAKIPFKYVKNVKSDNVGFFVKVLKNNFEVERLPLQENISIKLANKKYIV